MKIIVLSKLIIFPKEYDINDLKEQRRPLILEMANIQGP